MDKFNPFTFSGRLGRLQYFGFSILLGIIVWLVMLAFGAGSVDPNTGELGAGGAFTILLGMVVLFIASASYGVRRLHDFDKSGWWYLLAFIPVVGFFMALVLLFAPPTAGENSYGLR